MRILPPLLLAGTALAFGACGAAGTEATPGDERAAATFERNCLSCHDAAMATHIPKSRADWQATVERMMGLGAQVPKEDVPVIVDYLSRHYGLAQSTLGKPPVEPLVGLQLVRGKPIETRPPELAGNTPAFEGQTRAPYRRTVAIKTQVIAEGLDNPWALAFLPNGRFLVTEKPGALRIVAKDGTISPPIAGVPPVFYKSQVGLLDVALPADFAKSGRIFFSYMEPQPGSETMTIAIARARIDLAAHALADIKVIFRADPPITVQRAGNAGGRIAIAADGTLYAAIGDRVPPLSAGWNKAQDLNATLGKIIHITADGHPAPGNPYIGHIGAKPEIWTLGHRSIQGLTFDANGNLWEHEHGPRGGDELNLIRRGLNYGWPVIARGMEYRGDLINGGRTEQEGMEQPRYYWDPVIAPSGMAFYSGAEFPEWRGDVLIGALRGARLTRLTLSKDGKVVDEEPLLTNLGKRIRDVRVGPDGAVYILTDEASASLIRISRGERRQ